MRKVIINKLILGLLVLITLILIKPQEIKAEGLAVGNSIGSTDSMSSGNSGGPSMYRTGWLCVLTDSSGYRTLNSQVVFFPYLNTNTFAVCDGSITTEFFEIPADSCAFSSYINSVPCFQGNVPGGPILKSYFLQQCDNTAYANNALMVIIQRKSFIIILI